jgi:hypothetical protein
VDAGIAAGMTQDESEAEAVRKFGSPEQLMRGLMPASNLSVALRRLVSSAALLFYRCSCGRFGYGPPDHVGCLDGI